MTVPRDRPSTGTDVETGRALRILGRLHGELLRRYPIGAPTAQRDREILARLADTLLRLFEGKPVPNGDTAYLAVVAEAAGLDWSAVSPTIFGSMRQLVQGAPSRRPHGEHYTTEENVRKTLDPLLFDELRAELDRARDEAGLRRLWDRLAAVRLLDPACGCGNFLIVGYRDLRALESQVMRRLAWLGGPVGASRVHLAHLYGIEIDESSAALARTALGILQRQLDAAQRETGDEPTIVGGASALCLDWARLLPPSADVVVAGNPPFRGHKERTPAQGVELRAAWRTPGLQHLDYSTGWFAKAVEYFGDHDGRWAFVATNSVVQGESVPRLFRPIFDAGWRVAFAHRTFAWSATARAAAVHVVIVGFSRRPARPRLFDYPGPAAAPVEVPVARINGYLVDGPDVLVEPAPRPLSPELPEIRAGSTGIDWGHLTVGPADVAEVLADPCAARYLRRFAGGRELLNDGERWCLWMAGPEFDHADLLRSNVLRVRVERVRTRRAAASRAATRRLAEVPHLFGEIRQPTGPYLAVPQTFTQTRFHATAARLGADVIASMKLFTAPDPDGLLFAIFSSSMFLTWQRTVGGRLKSDPSLSGSVVWNTLPLPRLGADDRRRIAACGAGVLAARTSRPLARQYAPGGMAPALVEAHAALDELVDKAFGAVRQCSGERARQRLLFERYLDLANAAVIRSRTVRNPARTPSS